MSSLGHDTSGVSPAPRNGADAAGVDEQSAAQAADEERLIEAAKKGDVGAYEILIQRYERAAFRTASFIARDPSDAEEAVQDAFLKAYAALGRFRRGAAFKPWILKIVTNEAKNRRRSHLRHQAIAARSLSDFDKHAAVAPPDDGLLDEERRAALLAAVDDLSDEHREVVVCRYFLELSEDETANVLSLRPGTVKSRLSRALSRLEVELGIGLA